MENNANPNLKLSSIIEDWLHQRGKDTSAFRTITSDINGLDGPWSLEGCSFIATKNDRLGFVLGEAKEDDLVCVAYGSVYPLVLRQQDVTDGCYRLVGCAIIDELMDGEAFEMVKAGELEEQTILLR